MALDKITGNINRIKEIVENWKNIPEVSDIERELVLDKLKQIYEEVMFFDRDIITDDTVNISVEEKTETPTIVEKDTIQKEQVKEAELSEPAAETVRQVETKPIAETEQPAQTEPITETGPAQTAKSDQETSAPSLSKDKIEQEPASDIMEVPYIETPSDTSKRVVSEQILFEEEIHTPRRTVDKSTILSLYGNDPAMTHVKIRKPEPAQNIQEKIYQEPQTAHNAPSPQAQTAAPSENSTHKKVLGEVINNGHNTAVNEILGKQQPPHSDIASKISARVNTDLRHSIGLNDKFLLLRDLFGGDNSLYEETINTLDSFTDLDEAMIYIAENYSWNPDCDGAKLIVDLLERKLS